MLPCAAASAGSLGGDRRGFLFLESQLSIPIKRVRVVVASSTLAGFDRFRLPKGLLERTKEPRNKEWRSCHGEWVARMIG